MVWSTTAENIEIGLNVMDRVPRDGEYQRSPGVRAGRLRARRPVAAAGPRDAFLPAEQADLILESASPGSPPLRPIRMPTADPITARLVNADSNCAARRWVCARICAFCTAIAAETANS